MIHALILAAGESRRMGRPKMLLPFGDATIIEAVARTALASAASDVVAVLGAGEEKIRGAIAHLPVTIVVNTEYSLGMLSSIQCGFRHLSSDTRATVIMLGDQPAVPVEVVDRVIDAWRQSGKGLVLPVYGGRRGHPLLVDMRLSEEVLSLEPAKGMRAMLISNAAGIMEVPVATLAVLKDIDTPEDYEELMEGGGV
jgi:molybdenum cofactor cytidylyltransferase